jgi:hypothetical protein
MHTVLSCLYCTHFHTILHILSSIGSLVIVSRLKDIESVCMVMLFEIHQTSLLNKNFVWLETYNHCFQYSEISGISIACTLQLHVSAVLLLTSLGNWEVLSWGVLSSSPFKNTCICMCVCARVRVHTNNFKVNLFPL